MSEKNRPFNPPIDPTTGRPLSFAPRYTVPGVDVAETLLTFVSYRRAREIHKQQEPVTISHRAADKQDAEFEAEKKRIRRLPISDDEKYHQQWEAFHRAYVKGRAPETYVISYYMPTQPNHPMPKALIEYFKKADTEVVTISGEGKKTEKKPLIREDNPAIALNPNMERAVKESFAAIEGNCRGGFVLCAPVTRPRPPSPSPRCRIWMQLALFLITAGIFCC
jgi:hypothetical protein